MVNFGPLMAEIGWQVWEPQQISMGFASWLHYCTDITQWRSTKLCTMFIRLLGCYIIYVHFRGCCSLMEFCLCVQVLCSPVLAVLLHGTRAVAG